MNHIVRAAVIRIRVKAYLPACLRHDCVNEYRDDKAEGNSGRGEITKGAVPGAKLAKLARLAR